MSEVQCFCGELVSSLEDLVTHTIYSHTIEDRHSIDPRVFDMIEIENKKVKTEDGILTHNNGVMLHSKRLIFDCI